VASGGRESRLVALPISRRRVDTIEPAACPRGLRDREREQRACASASRCLAAWPSPSTKKAIVVPLEALVPTGEGFKVFVVDEKGIAEGRPVKIGGRTDHGAWDYGRTEGRRELS